MRYRPRIAPKMRLFAARLVAQAMKSVLLKALAKLQKVAHRRYAATDFQASSMREFAAILVVVRAVALAVLKDRVVGIIAVSALSKIRADSAVMWARRRALLTKRGWLFFSLQRSCVSKSSNMG